MSAITSLLQIAYNQVYPWKSEYSPYIQRSEAALYRYLQYNLHTRLYATSSSLLEQVVFYILETFRLLLFRRPPIEIVLSVRVNI